MGNLVTEVLSGGQWSGERVFCVGGGPSAKGFPWHLLRDEKVIAVNKSYLCGVSDINIGGDRRFWQKIAGPDKHYPTDTISVWADCKQANENFGLPNTLYRFKEMSGDQWSTDLHRGTIRSSDSGMRAVNLAFMLGASHVYLIGYDMYGGDDGLQDWWHAGYKRRQKNRIYRNFSFWYQKVPEPHRVTNLNPSSKLPYFEFASWQEILCEA